jgi:hypothetical protein
MRERILMLRVRLYAILNASRVWRPGEGEQPLDACRRNAELALEELGGLDAELQATERGDK